MRAAVSGRMPKLHRPVNHQPEVSGKFKRVQAASVSSKFALLTNRISLLTLAALTIGASMLMLVETSFRILGYPGFAMIFFMLAAIAGIGLAVTIVMTDVKAR